MRERIEKDRSGPISVRGETGYIDPVNGQPTTYAESKARVRVLGELKQISANTPTPADRQVVTEAKESFMRRARDVVVKRNEKS